MPQVSMMPTVIGLTGRAGTGKDTVARILSNLFGYRPRSFADPIRRGLVAMFEGLSPELLTDRGHKETPLEITHGTTPRRLMQTLGTEWGRTLIHPEIWVTQMEAWVERHQPYRLVIPDVRFADEARWIREERGGLVLRVVRDDVAPVEAHASESGLSDTLVDGTIRNTGSISHLPVTVLQALAEIAAPIYSDRNVEEILG